MPARQRSLLLGMAGALLSLAVLLMPVPPAWLADPRWRQLYRLARVAVLLLLPGLTLLRWVRPLDRLDDLQRLCLAPLVSLALFPLLLFWLGLAGRNWSARGVQVFLVACALRAILSLLRGWSRHSGWASARSARPGDALWGAGLVLVFAAALGVRLYMIRDLAYPAWVDSYQHTIITQIILETGRVPTSYAPFHDLPGFLYHFGFHAWSAFVVWSTDMPAHQAVLWGGQVLNALTVPSLFLLMDRLTRDRRAALVAAIVAGLVSRMPAFYVNWGRYPQLAGQVLLPAAALLTAESLSARRSAWRGLPLAAVLVAGLLFTHYRITLFYAAAALVILVGTWLAARRKGRRNRVRWWTPLGRLAIIGAGALLLTLPWLPGLLSKTLSTAQQVLAASGGAQYDYLTLEYVLGYGLRPSLLAAAGAAALWTLARARKKPLGLAVLAWLALVLWLANPRVSGLPSGFFTNGTVIIALYLPAALLIGLAVGDAWALLRDRLAQRRMAGALLTAALVVALMAASAWGGYWLARTGIEPWYFLVTDADVSAMRWVQASTPVDAVFAVGGEFWQDEGVSGYDAGLWLPYIARRSTLLPPVIYISEGDPGYVAQTAHALEPLYSAESPEALWRALRAAGAGYVYQSNRTPQDWHAHLNDGALFERLYDQGGVRVYRLLD